MPRDDHEQLHPAPFDLTQSAAARTHAKVQPPGLRSSSSANGGRKRAAASYPLGRTACARYVSCPPGPRGPGAVAAAPSAGNRRVRAFVLFFRRTYVPLRAILIPAPTFVPIQEVSHFVEAHHRDRRVDYVPSSVEEPKAGPKRPRKRFLTSIQVNQPPAHPHPHPHPPDVASNSQRLTTQSIPY